MGHPPSAFTGTEGREMDAKDVLEPVRKEFDSLESFVNLLWAPIGFSRGGQCERVRTVVFTSSRVFDIRAN